MDAHHSNNNDKVKLRKVKQMKKKAHAITMEEVDAATTELKNQHGTMHFLLPVLPEARGKTRRLARRRQRLRHRLPKHHHRNRARARRPPSPSKGLRPESGRRAHPEPSRRACPEQGRRAAPPNTSLSRMQTVVCERGSLPGTGLEQIRFTEANEHCARKNSAGRDKFGPTGKKSARRTENRPGEQNICLAEQKIGLAKKKFGW